MTEEEKDFIKAAITKVRDQQLAEFATLTIGLAAENHPEEIKKALSSVFDLTAIEETTRRMMAVITKCQTDIGECLPLLEAIHRDMDEIDKRIDWINARLTKAAKIVVKK